MTTFGAAIHQDTNSVKTSATYGDVGDGTSDWFHKMRAADGGLTTIGAKADAAVEGGSTTGSLIALIKGVQKALGINTDASAETGNGYVIAILKGIRDILQGPYSAAETPVSAASGNVANASCAATLAAVSAKTNYVTGFTITGAGATAAANVIATLTNTLGGTQSFIVTFPAGVTTAITPVIVNFDKPLKATAANTAVVLTVPAAGAGNTHTAVTLHGFYK